jgi:hypothetical protein
MSPDRFPSLWLGVPIFFGLFFGGGYVGILLSRELAPGSGLAEFVSFLALPAAFVVGIVAWAGAAIPAAVRAFAAPGLRMGNQPVRGTRSRLRRCMLEARTHGLSAIPQGVVHEDQA